MPEAPAQGGEPGIRTRSDQTTNIRRAPDVVLVGSVQGSGFRDAPWLVECDGRYVQLTELLYLILQALDGERSLPEVAQQVTERSAWRVTEDHVRQLAEQRLAPLGLVVLDDDASEAETRGHGSAGSPLQLHHQLFVLGAEQIDRVARLGKVLFAPPILVPALLAAATVHIWLYVRHGIGAPLQAMLRAPALVLAVLALVILGGLVHEFGHACALRYGGQRARGMGAGFYLVYPAFYTDTTDAYRLGRGARVRTDLGGFYFHLLFSLVVALSYVVTGAEWLLLVIVLIDLDIGRQLLPLVRLDGYWALSDLTGIPDLLSLTGPYLRNRAHRLIGRRDSSVDPMATLRRGPAIVFATYVLVTVPALIALLFFFLFHLPDVLTLGWPWGARSTRSASPTCTVTSGVWRRARPRPSWSSFPWPAARSSC